MVDTFRTERQVLEMGKQKRRRFSAVFKAEVCSLVLSGRKTVPEVCEEHELVESSVYAWVRQAKVDSGIGPEGAPTSSELEELRALRKKVKLLERERDFLVDAAAYFAKAKK